MAAVVAIVSTICMGLNLSLSLVATNINPLLAKRLGSVVLELEYPKEAKPSIVGTTFSIAIGAGVFIVVPAIRPT